jgi:hypothetical protein
MIRPHTNRCFAFFARFRPNPIYRSTFVDLIKRFAWLKDPSIARVLWPLYTEGSRSNLIVSSNSVSFDLFDSNNHGRQ